MSRTDTWVPKRTGIAPAEAMPDVLTASEAAAWLRVSLRTVYRMCRAGEIPHRRIGDSLRFSRRQLLEWLEGR